MATLEVVQDERAARARLRHLQKARKAAERARERRRREDERARSAYRRWLVAEKEAYTRQAAEPGNRKLHEAWLEMWHRCPR